MSRTAERVVWMMIGAAVGAGVALLYAPRTGKDARKVLRKRAENAREALADVGDTVLDKGRDVYETVADASRGAYASVADVGREAYRKSASAAAGAAHGATGMFGRRAGERH
ncbi:MAG TPA: YtxH domain-containing protein [Bryobacteraceae bacterium]|nr:YtxH domain-containing protein [Bryobacteraceae bacterium]